MLKNPSGFSASMVVAAILAFSIVGFVAWYVASDKQAKKDNKIQSINSFQECVATGNPIAQSYPEQCFADGKSFANPDQTAPPPPGQ